MIDANGVTEMTQTVTDAYLLGISEGRSLNAPPSLSDMIAFRDNCAAQLKRGFDRTMSDMFKGERDFWANQIRKASK